MSSVSNEREAGRRWPGPAMSLDLGEKRIGIALSDPTRLVATPHSVMTRKSRAEDFARLSRFIVDNQVTLIVMGLPITMAGHEGDRAAWVRDYAADLQRHVSVPIEFWDESLTTKQAEASLRAQGRSGRKIKQSVDAVAAALILQAFLDDDRPPLEPDHAGT